MDTTTIFLSYSHADKQLASRLHVALEQRGVHVWVDDLELRVGDSIVERVAQAIADGDFLVAIVSPDSIKSEWCRRELSLAATKGIAQKAVVVLPIRYRKVEMPAALSDRRWLDADETDVVALADRLVADISRHRGLDTRTADVAWLASARHVYASESDAAKAMWVFELEGAARNPRPDVRIDGGGHYTVVDRLCRLGALTEVRRSRRFMFYRISDRGRLLLEELRRTAPPPTSL